MVACLIILALAFDLFSIEANADSVKPATISAIHGEEQLDQFLKDRPQLSRIVRKGNTLWNWLRDGFGNEKDGIRIFWENKPTSDFNSFGAESRFTADSNNVYIRVDRCYKKGEFAQIERSAEEILIDIVFELNNAKNRSRRLELGDLADRGQISKHDYALAIAKEEYTASLDTGAFYTQIWIPFCHAHNFEYEAFLWSFTSYGNFDSWLGSFPKDSGYPFRSYGKELDQSRL